VDVRTQNLLWTEKILKMSFYRYIIGVKDAENSSAHLEFY
jgi:hypothetical protein